jgi:hypothetical protein
MPVQAHNNEGIVIKHMFIIDLIDGNILWGDHRPELKHGADKWAFSQTALLRYDNTLRLRVQMPRVVLISFHRLLCG